MPASISSLLLFLFNVLMLTILLLSMFQSETKSSMPATTMKPIHQSNPAPSSNVSIYELPFSSYLKNNSASAIINDTTPTKHGVDLLILNTLIKNPEQQEIADTNNSNINETTFFQESVTTGITPYKIINANTTTDKIKESKQQNTKNTSVNFLTTETIENKNLGVITFPNNPLTNLNDNETINTESEIVYKTNDNGETTQQNTANPLIKNIITVINEKKSQADTMPVLDTQNATSVTYMQNQSTTREYSDKNNIRHTLPDPHPVPKIKHDKSETNQHFSQNNTYIKNCLGEIEILCAEKISRLIFLHTRKTTNENHFLHEVLCVTNMCGFKDRKTCIDKAKAYINTQVKQCEKPHCIKKLNNEEGHFNQPTQKSFKAIWSKAYNSYPIYVSTPLHNIFDVKIDECEDITIDSLPLSLQFYKNWIHDLKDPRINLNGNIKTVIYKKMLFVQSELEYSYLFMAENQNHDNEFFSLIKKAKHETNSYHIVNMPHNKSDKDLAGLCQKRIKHIVNAETLAIHALFYPYCIGHVGFDISKDKRKEPDYYAKFKFYSLFVVNGVRVIQFKMEYLKQ